MWHAFNRGSCVASILVITQYGIEDALWQNKRSVMNVHTHNGIKKIKRVPLYFLFMILSASWLDS